jgi:hypothetical protein
MPVHDDPEIYDASGSSSEPSKISGPPLSSNAPGPLKEPLPDGLVTEPDETESEQVAPLPQFDPRYTDEFSGLLYLGFLKDEFEWAGHKFEIKTLKSDELLEITLATKKYIDTIGASRAYATAIAAACLVKVDKKYLPIPLTTDEADSAFKNKFDYVLSNWHPMVVDAVYSKYMELEATVGAVIESMGKAVS